MLVACGVNAGVVAIPGRSLLEEHRPHAWHLSRADHLNGRPWRYPSKVTVMQALSRWLQATDRVDGANDPPNRTKTSHVH